jgi:hypothetical protein
VAERTTEKTISIPNLISLGIGVSESVPISGISVEKPIVVYTENVLNSNDSTAGIKINNNNTTIQFNVGISDTGITFEHKNGNYISSTTDSISTGAENPVPSFPFN